MAAIEDRAKLIVGIDYGTTYSGLSFALSNSADFKDVFPWTKYPGAASHHAEHCVKAPTRIAFKDENPDLEENAWGYQVEPGMHMYALTKLLLDESSLQSEYDDPDLYLGGGREMMRLPKGKSAKDVATEYLRGMHKMFEDVRTERFSSLDDLPIDFWLTVPASWSEKAKLLTKNAALDAGFATRPIDRVMLIAEPEAAAHYALKSNVHRLQSFVQPKTGVLVCDCGGGTVDITTYEVERTEPTLALREVAVGVAGKCGGTFVDRNFFKLLGDRFGDAFTSLSAEQIGPGSSFMDQFELKKKDFGSSAPSKRAHRIPLHMPQLKRTAEMEEYYENRSSSVLLRHQDYKSLFDPVVDTIVDLIDNQVSQVKSSGETAIDTIILVGGFGSSPYLRETISSWCQSRNIRLTTPITGAWSAVVCGAVLRGLEGSIVQNKKCRRHYGHQLSRSYNPILNSGYDTDKRYTWTNFETGSEQLTGFMFWEMGKGDKIDKDTVINSHFTHYPKHTIPKCGTHELYSCSLDNAPATIENDRIEKVGTVVYDLTNIDKSKVRHSVRDGVTQYAVDLVLNIKLDDDRGHLVFRILCDGKEVGKAGIDIGQN